MLLDSFQELADGKVTGKNYAEVKTDIFGFRSVNILSFTESLKKTELKSQEYYITIKISSYLNKSINKHEFTKILDEQQER